MEKEERKFQKGCLWDIFITLLEFESLCCNTTKVVRCTLDSGKKSLFLAYASLKPQKIPWRRSQPYSSTTCYKSNKFHLYAGDLIGICILPRLNSVVVFLQAAHTFIFLLKRFCTKITTAPSVNSNYCVESSPFDTWKLFSGNNICCWIQRLKNSEVANSCEEATKND